VTYNVHLTITNMHFIDIKQQAPVRSNVVVLVYMFVFYNVT